MNTLLKLLKSSVNLLEYKYVRMPLIIILIVYAAAVAPNLSRYVNDIMNNTVVRIFVLLAVVLLAHKDIVLALLLVVAYLMSTGKLVENLKNKDDTSGNSKKNSTSAEGNKKNDSADTGGKDIEGDDTEGDDTEGSSTEDNNKEKFESKDESGSGDPKSSSPHDLDEKELDEGEEKKVEIENFELNSGCTPEGYNSRYNCFDNTGDASPCSPCGEVGAFDNEIGPQGLSQMTGYPGTEYSQV